MADPRTIKLPGSLTDTQQYELAPGLAQYVQSVYVEVDNTAGADARPTLTLSEQSGVVIAKKRQGEAIPAGGTGSATWALRLTDEEAGGSGGSGLQYDTDNEGDWFFGAANDASGSPNGDSWQFDTGASDAPFAVTGDGGFVIDTSGTVDITGGGITLSDLTVTPGPTVVTALTATSGIFAEAGIDNNGQRITNGADGVNPTDFATVEQLPTFSGVSSLAKSGDTPLTGDVTLSEGANVTLTQVGQDIEIATTPGSGGIDFDIANSGDWLDIATTGVDSGGLGVDVEDSGGGILLHSTGEGQLSGDGAAKLASGTTTFGVFPGFVQALLDAGAVFQVLDSGNAPVLNVTAATELGFFNVAPVAQQATPVTLADVIALLQAYGLSA